MQSCGRATEYLNLLILETPNGTVSATVHDVFIANAQVDSDGVVTISFFPMERHPDEDAS
jgi:hypothetical protein